MRGPRSRWLRRSFLRGSNHGQARRELHATRSRAGFGSGERYGEGEELGERGGEDAFEVDEMIGCRFIFIQTSAHLDQYLKDGRQIEVVQSNIVFVNLTSRVTSEVCCPEGGEK